MPENHNLTALIALLREFGVPTCNEEAMATFLVSRGQVVVPQAVKDQLGVLGDPDAVVHLLGRVSQGTMPQVAR